MSNAISIGTIFNSSGALYIMEKDGRYFWLLSDFTTNYDDLRQWEEIDRDLYESLIKWEHRRLPVR